MKRRNSKLVNDKGDSEADVDDSLNDSTTSRSMFTELMLNGKEDYESAVFQGYDLHPDGDKALNGFSSRG